MCKYFKGNVVSKGNRIQTRISNVNLFDAVIHYFEQSFPSYDFHYELNSNAELEIIDMSKECYDFLIAKLKLEAEKYCNENSTKDYYYLSEYDSANDIIDMLEGIKALYEMSNLKINQIPTFNVNIEEIRTLK